MGFLSFLGLGMHDDLGISVTIQMLSRASSTIMAYVASSAVISMISLASLGTDIFFSKNLSTSQLGAQTTLSKGQTSLGLEYFERTIAQFSNGQVLFVGQPFAIYNTF